MKLIDLSSLLHNQAVNDPPAQRPTIIYTDHVGGRDNMLTFFLLLPWKIYRKD